MGLPFLLWVVMWLFVFPGDKNGFDSALTTVLLAGSAPLVLWFYFCSLGFIANSMGGANEFDRPRAPLIAMTIGVLPPAAVCLGIAGTLYMLSLDAASYAIAAPLALGLMIAASIRQGERARRADRRSAEAAGFRGRHGAPRWRLNSAAGHRLWWAMLAGTTTLLVALQWTSDARLIVAGFALAIAGLLVALSLTTAMPRDARAGSTPASKQP